MDENTNIPNDVNTQTDTSTDGGSSPAEQTPAGEAQNTSESSTQPEIQTAGDKTVPYDRFAEVNTNFRQTQKELETIKQQLAQQAQHFQQPQQQVAPEVAEAKQQLVQLLKEVGPELGYVSKEEIAQQRVFEEVKTTETNLANKYNGKDGLPKYDAEAVRDYAINNLGITSPKGLEAAYKSMHSAEITNALVQKALAQSRGVQSETSNGTGSANTGVTNDDLMKAAQEGDKDATHLLLKRRLSSK